MARDSSCRSHLPAAAQRDEQEAARKSRQAMTTEPIPTAQTATRKTMPLALESSLPGRVGPVRTGRASRVAEYGAQKAALAESLQGQGGERPA